MLSWCFKLDEIPLVVTECLLLRRSWGQRDGQFRFNQDWAGGKKGSVGHYHFGPFQVPMTEKLDR